MTVSTLTWDKVTVTYKEKIQPCTFRRATISFNQKTAGLSIGQSTGNSDSDKHLLLARAELIKISPWDMKWKAYWWSADPIKPGFKELIEAEVTCEF